MTKPDDLTVFITGREATCDECGAALGRHAWIRLVGDGKCACLDCADLSHLVYLASGDTALTRRARKHSRLSAVVLKWAKARKRYERQGLLVEEPALDRAEEECAADAKQRELRRLAAIARRAELDADYVAAFAERTRALYPNMPPGREQQIAAHACRKYSGRVGRSADAKALDPEAIRLAVVAHIRHAETGYDELLLRGEDRSSARRRIQGDVARVLAEWSGASGLG